MDVSQTRQHGARRGRGGALSRGRHVAGLVGQRQQGSPDRRSSTGAVHGSPATRHPHGVAGAGVQRHVGHHALRPRRHARSRLPRRPGPHGAGPAATGGPPALALHPSRRVEAQHAAPHANDVGIGGWIVDAGVGAPVGAVVGTLIAARRQHGHALGHGLRKEVM